MYQYQKGKRAALLFLLPIALALLCSQFSLAQEDVPSIEDIRVQEKAIVGERFDIVVVAKNGNSYVDRGYITVSFPDARCPDGTFATVEVLKPSAGDAYTIYPPSELLFNKREPTGEYKTKIKAVYPIAEIALNPWQPNEFGELRVYVTPCQYPHQMRIYVRVSADSGRYYTRQVVGIPSQYQADAVDQQGFGIYERLVAISAPTPTAVPILIPTAILIIPTPTRIPIPTSTPTPDQALGKDNADSTLWNDPTAKATLIAAIIGAIALIVAAFIERSRRHSQ